MVRQRLICFKYYILLKWESCFISSSIVQEIPITSENVSNKNCSELHFSQKTQ